MALDTVTAMIAPAVFMTACGSLLLSTNTRVARIVDRIRALVELDEVATRTPCALDFPEVRRRHIAQQLRHLQWRSNRVLVAGTMLHCALASFAACSIAIALDTLIGHSLIIAAVAFAILGVALVLVACANLVLEARGALASNHLEVTFHNELVALRQHARDKST